MPIYIYAYIHICLYTYMHIYIYAYIHICLYTYIEKVKEREEGERGERGESKGEGEREGCEPGVCVWGGQ